MTNRWLVYILLTALGVWACDTTENIRPRNDNFFVKMYDGVRPGNEEGVDIIETSDGGLLIAGTSDSLNTTEILLIKTDSRGNEVWTYNAANDLGAGINSAAKSIVELTDGYLVGGNVDDGSVTRSILLKVSFDGTLLNKAIIKTDTTGGVPFENTLSKVTLGPSGILICGETLRETNNNDGGRNGYVTLYDPNSFQPDPALLDSIIYFGLDGDEFVAGGYEVMDTINNIGNQKTRFLVFGSTQGKTIGADKKFFYIGFQRDFLGPVPGIESGLVSNPVNDGDQLASYVTRFNDNFWVVGTAVFGNQEQLLVVGWSFGGGINDWKFVGNLLTSNNNVVGKSIGLQKEDQIVITGDINYNENHSEIYLVKTRRDLQVSSPWPRTYGTNTSTYRGGAVTVLSDGSIVLVGTADLETTRKIVVIKTGPDGQMSF